MESVDTVASGVASEKEWVNPDNQEFYCQMLHFATSTFLETVQNNILILIEKKLWPFHTVVI